MLQTESGELKDPPHSQVLDIPENNPALLSTLVSLASTQNRAAFGSLPNSSFSGLINGLNSIVDESNTKAAASSSEAKPEASDAEGTTNSNLEVNSPNSLIRLPDNQQHSSSKQKHLSSNQQHSSSNQQHPSSYKKHSSCNEQHAYSNQQHSSSNEKILSSNHKHLCNNQQHSSCNQQHSSYDKQHSSSNHLNILSNQLDLFSNQTISPVSLIPQTHPGTHSLEVSQPSHNTRPPKHTPHSSEESSFETFSTSPSSVIHSRQTPPPSDIPHRTSSHSNLASKHTPPLMSRSKKTPPPSGSKRAVNEVCDHRLKFISGTTYACTNCSDYFERLPAECLTCQLCGKHFTHRHLLLQHSNEVHAVTWRHVIRDVMQVVSLALLWQP